MGRIKTMLIKRSVNTLLKNNPKKFTSTFDKNKKAVSEQLDVRSKKLRNIIAGYLTKQVKAQKN
ncbi:30S ribosomal protein S17e [Candidatus Woesearchaeota archaeon]|nr:30S ribosomal protein S17e [Candidatus Woesearchaeota archaeon]